ncbi:MAG TPA: hypothetical protein ACHBX0_09285 [Arsenophonus sp.]
MVYHLKGVCMCQVGKDVSKKKLDICLLIKGINGKHKIKLIENHHHPVKTLIEYGFINKSVRQKQ